MAKIMGIDYGSKRIGIAMTDEQATIAFPKAVLPNDKFLLMSIVDMVVANKIAEIVIGESKDNRGADNVIMDSARTFADTLKRETGATIVYEPEFYSSQEARAHFGPKNGPEHIDASAAAIILNSYLNKRASADTA
ncbi:MAG: RuvX/YqgF family protein [Patescibacteria group bacterium]